MTAIVAANVTYSNVNQRVEGQAPYKRVSATIVFGNGSLTYPTGGIPLVAGNLGCAREIQSFGFVDESAGDGYIYKYDKTNQKIRIYQSGGIAVSGGVDTAATPLVEVTTAYAPAATTLKVEVWGS